MKDDCEEVLMVALLVLTKELILDYSDELGISEKQLTDDVIAKIKGRVGRALTDCRRKVKNIIVDTLKAEIIEGKAGCPLGLTCYPSCAFMEGEGCQLPKKVSSG